MVIGCSICGKSCWDGVDGFWLKDWGRINDWVDGEGILAVDRDCWMFVICFKCWWFVGNEERWGCGCKTLCEGKDSVGSIFLVGMRLGKLRVAFVVVVEEC